jgi:hypothetical protein
MSSETTPVTVKDLADADLEHVTAGKDFARSELQLVNPRFWAGAFNPNNWEVRRGAEANRYLQEHNML